MMEVRPSHRRSKEAWILASVTLSNALVASSKMTMGGFLRNTRAILIRCFCPPGEHDPSFSYIGFISIGHGQNVLMDLCLAGSQTTSSSVASGRPYPDIFQDTVCKQENLLLDNSDVLAEGMLCDFPDIVSINEDCALCHIVKTGESVDIGWFSRRRMVQQRQIFPRLEWSVRYPVAPAPDCCTEKKHDRSGPLLGPSPNPGRPEHPESPVPAASAPGTG